MIRLKAGDLADALKPARPHARKKKPKPVPVSLEQDFVSSAFSVIEARHGSFGKSLPCSGNWPKAVQVDGVLLEKLVATWPAEAELELIADAERLQIRVGKSITFVNRLDDGGSNLIARTPPKPDARHKGKPVIPPDPVSKRVELADTWGFSARVPMPQHRGPKDKDG